MEMGKIKKMKVVRADNIFIFYHQEGDEMILVFDNVISGKKEHVLRYLVKRLRRALLMSESEEPKVDESVDVYISEWKDARIELYDSVAEFSYAVVPGGKGVVIAEEHLPPEVDKDFYGVKLVDSLATYINALLSFKENYAKKRLSELYNEKEDAKNKLKKALDENIETEIYEIAKDYAQIVEAIQHFEGMLQFIDRLRKKGIEVEEIVKHIHTVSL